MQASKSQETRNLIGNVFREAVEAAISEVSTLDWQVAFGEGGEQADLSRAVGFRFDFDGASSGEVIVGIHYDLLPRLGFRDVQDDAPDVAIVQKNTLMSALEGKRSLVEANLSKAGAVTLQIELVDNPALADHEVLELQCRPKSEGDESTFPMFVCISPKLIADLQSATAEPFVFPNAPETAGSNLDLVMDVELNVTLRFGQRQLALREVLELASGSVVELDRQVDEPIELILDGKVVARGEAVIIDGNYGMRVTQVLQPMVS